mmetsp:Transcript_25777/g.43008  ORF Transcript_25777/g.43008 Transcript_25777/m.43008 type:complete len:93 (-) Transcript_25777:217-495(-)|eukprot:CAMPEP_0175002208 /NCGR_PEP_ID=MMETSP0005-20121125/3558_1 /TAXON_ID=420556 /ORGANISM="Ochromonas sp., Strain CCMP1393" /LENGTH=92 /DNA_ID=CAMNT_0016257173 /DNA_START=42 /DNA_END=320 /DNA_ORIENTATION=-
MTTESFGDKALRKCIEEPLVPVGALATTAFLTAGLRAFHSGNKSRSQALMRGRVIAQGVTVAAICMGGFMGFKPNANRPKNVEETLPVYDRK